MDSSDGFSDAPTCAVEASYLERSEILVTQTVLLWAPCSLCWKRAGGEIFSSIFPSVNSWKITPLTGAGDCLHLTAIFGESSFISAVGKKIIYFFCHLNCSWKYLNWKKTFLALELTSSCFVPLPCFNFSHCNAVFSRFPSTPVSPVIVASKTGCVPWWVGFGGGPSKHPPPAPSPFFPWKMTKGLRLIRMQKRFSRSFISNFFSRQENHFCLALNNNGEHGEPRWYQSIRGVSTAQCE